LIPFLISPSAGGEVEGGGAMESATEAAAMGLSPILLEAVCVSPPPSGPVTGDSVSLGSQGIYIYV